MPTRDTAVIGAPCWIDLMTSDTARSREFYCQLFGWTAEEPAEEFGGYFNFLKDGARIAGCMGSQQPEMPDAWSVYLAVDDAKATADAAASHGAQVHVPAMDIADFGAMAVLGDPGGAAVSIWQPGTHQDFGVLNETGAPSWFELHTRDYETTLAFYREVFGWDTQALSDTPEFRYTIVKRGEDQLAGVMDAAGNLAEGVPSHWSVYFGVDDTNAALARITELGGSTVTEAQDTPYGRLATAADSTGAQFKLLAPNESMSAKWRSREWRWLA